MPGQVPKTQELGRFAASFRRLRFEKPSASGGFAPLSPHQGLCPWTPLGALPPDSRYRLMLRPRHGLAPSNENFCVRPCLSHSCCAQTTERIKLPFITYFLLLLVLTVTGITDITRFHTLASFRHRIYLLILLYVRL